MILYQSKRLLKINLYCEIFSQNFGKSRLKRILKSKFNKRIKLRRENISFPGKL
jgi:hypothetical protein